MFPIGVQAVGELGEAEVDAGANVDVTGVFGTGQIGTVVARAAAGVVVTGVFGTGETGDVTVEGKASVIPTGAVGTGIVSKVLIWQVIDDSQDSDWVAVVDGNNVVWVEIPT